MNRSRLVRFVAAAELPFVLAIAPLLLFPTASRLLVLVAVPIFWLCAKSTTGHVVPRTPMNLSLWILLAMIGISLWTTADVQQSLSKVSGVIFGVLLYWAMTRWMTTPARLMLGTGAFLFAGSGLAVVGLLAAPANFSQFSSPSLQRLLFGPIVAEVHPNPVAGCLILFVPLQIALLAASTRHQWRWGFGRLSGRAWPVAFQLILLGLTVGTLVLMRSRGAWIGLIVAIGAVLMWRGRLTRIVVAGVAILLVIAMALTSGPDMLNHKFLVKAGSTPQESVSFRTGLWSRAIEGIREYPLAGMGMNMFRTVMPVRYPVYPPPAFPGTDLAHAHNNLLQTGVDVGVPGLVAYASLWLLVLVLLRTVYRRSANPVYRAMAGGLGAGFIAHFVFGLADAVPLGSKLGVVFWISLALTAALHRVAMTRPSEIPNR